MSRELYDRLSLPFRSDEKKRRRLVSANRVITAAFYVIYIFLVIFTAVARDPRIIRVILVPLISFAAVSVFRRICNTKRPYEIWDIEPLIPREASGMSFPSRHVFSCFILSMTMTFFCMPAAVIMMAAGVFLAAVRVIAGVHFVKDVIAGALIGIGLGIIGFWVI